MLCGFKDDSVMVECINKKEWNSLHDVVSIGINEPNTFHTVKSDGVTFKARPLSGDIRMLKGFLTFFKRMADTEGRLLDEDDVMDTFTTTDFKRYCRTMDYHSDMVAAGSVSSPSFETLIADGVFHVESALIPSVVVTTTLPPDTEEDQEGAVSMNGLVFGTSKSTETTSKTIKGMPETLGTSVTIHRSSKPTIGTPGASTVMVGSTCTTLSPIINHVIMLCGFESNSVFVEYINQEGWSKLSHVMSMSVTDVNAVHTVESNRWTFRSRPDEKEIQVFKGLLLYHARLSNTLNRPLNENDVMMLITKSVFDCYLSSEDYHVDMLTSGADRIPSFDEMARSGVFHVEEAPHSLLVSAEGSKAKDVAMDVEVNNHGSSNNCLFAESWLIDGALNDMEEYELVFEEEDMTAGSLSCALIADCSNVEEEPLVLQRDISISKWGAKYEVGAKYKVMHDGFNVLQGGTIKHEALNVIENGEQMFVVYNQRMLIAVLDSARVFDPGGQDNKMEKVNQNILFQQ
jgi:hypothetical protein